MHIAETVEILAVHIAEFDVMVEFDRSDVFSVGVCIHPGFKALGGHKEIQRIAFVGSVKISRGIAVHAEDAYETDRDNRRTVAVYQRQTEIINLIQMDNVGIISLLRNDRLIYAVKGIAIAAPFNDVDVVEHSGHVAHLILRRKQHAVAALADQSQDAALVGIRIRDVIIFKGVMQLVPGRVEKIERTDGTVVAGEIDPGVVPARGLACIVLEIHQLGIQHLSQRAVGIDRYARKN